MGALCCRLFCRKKQMDYKKVDEARTPDIEGGGLEFDEWDEFPEEESARTPLTPGGSLPPDGPEPEAEPEPEPEPFAGFGMAPQIVKTKRHEAASAWAPPAAPTSSRLQLSSFAMEAESEAGGGWADDDIDLGDGERRRVAEERRAQRRRDQAARKADGGGASATRVKATRGGAVAGGFDFDDS